MTALPPEAVAFDVVETLFSLDGVARRLAGVGAPGGAPQLWFARLLREGFALAACGDYRPFGEVAAASLRSVLPDADDGVVEEVLGGLGQLEPHPDAEPALRRASEAGLRIVTLTSGSLYYSGATVTASGSGWSTWRACCSAPFSPGNPGRWPTRPIATARSPTRCLRRRS